ncbi:UDP-N-acetylmuramate--L-alanine ligase [Croceivirga sp. JEA036]|uniref:UDP-N-acetylmuramate--L-alanine ligase n=1 Tax=Croceivirga sp. JEA036 TaxID=2721162 RepID=UPI00143BF710|nr:UDP-N-acetylmuramate--L-alanine ligase [Croceivirga sp. JEA036]NJB36077.1 UDP-N-acetylmuramate--L-alanine ligase [Croceivirga sp. JEA036]
MNIKDINSVYFVGIGGIGMSALARYFQFIGKQVAGYDKTKTPLTQELESSGVLIHYEDAVSEIPDFCKTVNKTLVVYTPAIPQKHSELAFFNTQDFNVLKRAEVLGLITKNAYSFAVAGTHGKTTTSSILAHLLKVVDAPFSGFLGGISEDFNSNFIFNGSKYAVVEADEYDRSFLQLHPDMACITSMDADHLDIYGDEETLVDSFKAFKAKLSGRGKLFVPQTVGLEGVTYGIEDGSDYCATDVRVQNGYYCFNIQTPKKLIKDVVFAKPGRHNLANALVAFAMAVEAGFNASDLAKGLASFKGVQRRFSYQIKNENFLYIDDYAHHPTEIDAAHQAVREMHPGKKVTVIFQPHLFSRTRDFLKEFAKSLAQFDEVILLEIYPAREEPIPGVTSAVLLSKIDHPKKRIVEKDSLVEELKKGDLEVLMTLGAGDIGLEVEKIKNGLTYAN